MIRLSILVSQVANPPVRGSISVWVTIINLKP
jgi:hypothetical protein